MHLWMISGQANESPGLLDHRAELVWKETVVLQDGRAELIQGGHFCLSHTSYQPSNQESPWPLTTPALVRPRKLCSVMWPPPREPHSLLGEHSLLFHFQKLSLSSTPLSRPPVYGACPRVVGTRSGHLWPRAPGHLVEALSREAGPNAWAGVPPRSDSHSGLASKWPKGAAGFPAHRALGQEGVGVHPGLQGRWSLLRPKAKSMDWSSCASLSSPKSNDFYFNPN